MDGYCAKYIIVIKDAIKRKNMEDLAEIINRIHEEGFQEGYNEKSKEVVLLKGG